ncbi:putative diguanylate cyclase YdaM [Microbulbifer aggregans]|uniref:diguanylate cyclase n=1 Tax=Microbulbifer aggregans TaxID=1769779 RepID=A0A1C9W4W7_9GAMM|nr:GGDEF domain-containing protein [Microbulbifer aggregans]AOS96204.1 putative diguanylate cyclase YdaM [Microbulbifer aggregans]
MNSGLPSDAYDLPSPVEQARKIELRRRILASGYMLIFAMAITGAMAVMALTDGEMVMSGVLFGIAGIILGAYVAINLLGQSGKTPVLVGLLLVVLYFYLLLSGGVKNTGLMWAVTLVPGFINLYGYRTGTATLLAIGGATALILFYPEFPGLTAEYDTSYRARFLAVFGALTALTALLDSSRHQTQQLLHHLTEELEARASTDALTGLVNRREAYRAINELERRDHQMHGRYTVLIGDLDNFKAINDEYGHSFGDRVLRDVAQVLQENTRVGDIVSRWGGEEFLILLPNTDLDGGGILAEKLRQRVEALSDTYEERVKVSISFGVAEGGAHDDTHGELLAEADERMYRAKHHGRNRVVAV